MPPQCDDSRPTGQQYLVYNRADLTGYTPSFSTELPMPPAASPSASPPAESGIEAIEVIAETPRFRIARLTLAPGQAVPWHYHSRVADRLVCIAGAIEVKTRAPRSSITLRPGEAREVPAMTAHRVGNPGPGPAVFLAIQSGGTYDRHPVGGAGPKAELGVE